MGCHQSVRDCIFELVLILPVPSRQIRCNLDVQELVKVVEAYRTVGQRVFEIYVPLKELPESLRPKEQYAVVATRSDDAESLDGPYGLS